MGSNKKGFNNYKIVDDYVIIYLERRDGIILETYIDLEDLEGIKILCLHWNGSYQKEIKGYYAKATEYLGTINGQVKYRTRLLHREIISPKERRIYRPYKRL